MPIRVQMPNGTVRPFKEGTPKSVIRRAQQDMLTDMKASGAYDGFDFSEFEDKPRKVTVTQLMPDEDDPYSYRRDAYSDRIDQERADLENEARARGLTEDDLRKMQDAAMARATVQTALREGATSLALGPLGGAIAGTSKVGQAILGGARMVDQIHKPQSLADLPLDIGEKARNLYLDSIRDRVRRIDDDALIQQDIRNGRATRGPDGIIFDVPQDW